MLSELKKEADRKASRGSPGDDEDLRLQISKLLSYPYPSPQFRPDAVDLLKRLYLPKQINADSVYCSYSWILHLKDLQGLSESLDTSLLALCVGQLYVTSTGPGTLEQGLALYNNAITKLRSEIEHPETRFREETVATIIVLSTCELFMGAADDGFRAHTLGISEILRQSSQPTFRSRTWQALLTRLRIICVGITYPGVPDKS